MDRNFAGHGRYSIEVADRVVCIGLYGSMNQETGLEYIESYKRITAPLRGSDYAHLVEFRHWGLATPETQEMMPELQEWMIRNGCVAEAFLISNGGEGDIQRSLIEHRDPSSVGDTERAFFKDLNNALAWLMARGFSLDVERATGFITGRV